MNRADMLTIFNHCSPVGSDAERVLELETVEASYSEVAVFMQDVDDYVLKGIESGQFDDHELDVVRSRRHADMFEAASKYYRALEGILKMERGQIRSLADCEMLTELKETLDELSEPFSNDPAFIAFLSMKRAAKLGKDA